MCESVVDIISQDTIQTIIVCDGVMNGPNIGNIVRNTCLVGATDIFFCPLDKHRHDKIKIQYKNEEKALKHFERKDDVYMYKPSSIKGHDYFSRGLSNNIRSHYNIPITTIIDAGIRNKFDIYVLENNLNTSKCLFECRLFAKKVMFVCGNECLGVSGEIQELCQQRIIKSLFIPSQINQPFNVSFAVYSAAFERFRQQQMITNAQINNKLI